MTITLATVVPSANAFAGATTPDTASISVVTGDYLVVMGCSGSSTQDMSAPSGGGLTYTFGNSAGVNLANLNGVDLYYTAITTPQTFTVSRTISPNNSTSWGFILFRFSGVTAIGANATGGNATASLPSVSITTGAVNSAIVMINTDYLEVLTAPTYLTATAGTFVEQNHTENTGVGTVFAGWYPNAGTAGVKTIGLTVPTNQQWSLVALELQGPPQPATGTSGGPAARVSYAGCGPM
jgi:hypothetical protein